MKSVHKIGFRPLALLALLLRVLASPPAPVSLCEQMSRRRFMPLALHGYADCIAPHPRCHDHMPRRLGRWSSIVDSRTGILRIR